MAHQVVATSVPRGLDGVSGYQTVLKSAGIPPRLFDRLKARSGYSHRYPHGDSRNPIVFIHRIEELGGSRWHVLGCIRDAGSDHTGRSNFLAHMVGIDSNEARTKPGGPAAAAIARGCFLENWSGPPEPAAPPKTLVAADRPPQPGDAPAWKAAGLDAGLAGDLAAAAMANKKVVIVTRPGDDVLALFVDALRLVEPSKRWGVTFNTCAIEDFDGTWKAIRSDLIDAKDMRDSKADLMDLTSDPRSSSDPYARFARGESDSLPWRKPSSLAESEPGNAAAVPNEPAKASDARQATTELRRSRKKKTHTAAQRSHRERRPRYEEVEESHRSPWFAVAVAAGILLLLGSVAVIPFRDQLLSMVGTPKAEPVIARKDLAQEPVKVPTLDGIDDRKYEMATTLKDARSRLVAGHDGLTSGALKQKATETLERIETLRRTWPQIFEKAGQDFDPTVEATGVINTCEQVAECLELYGSVKLNEVQKALEEVLKAEGELKVAVASLDTLQKKLDDLEADAKRRQVAMQADERKKRMHQAFQSLRLINESVSLPSASIATLTDIGGPVRYPERDETEIKLGAFLLADLVEPKIRLAVPRDTIADAEFKAEIVKVAHPDDDVWEIRYAPTGVGVEGGKSKVPPRQLASLFVRDSQLFLKVSDVTESNAPPYALLRRSVILLEAKDPSLPDAQPYVHAIRLVEPMKVEPLVIELFAKRSQEQKLTPPRGIARVIRTDDGSNANLELPVNGVRFDAEFPGGQTVTVELPKDAPDGGDPGIWKWVIPLTELGPDLSMRAVIGLTFPNATMTVRTEFVGKNAQWFDKEEVSKAIHKSDKALTLLRRKYEQQVSRGKEISFEELQTTQVAQKIEKWFKEPLVGSATALVRMPDHESVRSSFELYLKQQFDTAQKRLKPGEKPDLPETFDQFAVRVRRATNPSVWVKEFSSPITHWASWFWPQFKKQWTDNVALFKSAADEHREICITAITSLAFDETGVVYEVPLIVKGDAPRSDAGRLGDTDLDANTVEKDEPDSTSSPEALPQPARTGTSVGID